VTEAEEIYEAACDLIMDYGPRARELIRERIALDKLRNDRLSIEAWEDVDSAVQVLLAFKPCLGNCQGMTPADREEVIALCRPRSWVEGADRRKAS